MFHLQPGVHLHKEEIPPRIQQKFHRTGAHVTNGLRRPHGRFAHGAPQLGAEPRRRGFFNHFLVTALDGAIPFVEVQAMAVLIGKHLNLHMPGLEHVFFDQHACIAKRRQRFTLSRSQCFGQLAFVVHHFHALAATPGGGFKQDRVADVLSRGAKGLQILRLAVITRHQRHPGHFHQGLGGGFTAHGINGRGGRA